MYNNRQATAYLKALAYIQINRLTVRRPSLPAPPNSFAPVSACTIPQLCGGTVCQLKVRARARGTTARGRRTAVAFCVDGSTALTGAAATHAHAMGTASTCIVYGGRPRPLQATLAVVAPLVAPRLLHQQPLKGQ
jgi:hypothetical protein